MEGSGCHCLGGAFSRLPETLFSLDPCQIFLSREKVDPVGGVSPTHCPTEALGRVQSSWPGVRQLPASTMPGPRKPPQTRGVLTLRSSEWAPDLGQGGAGTGRRLLRG